MKSWRCRSVLGLFFLVACSIAIAGAADVPQKPTYTFKLQSGWTASDFPHQTLVHFGEAIEAMAGGRVKMEVMSAGAIEPNSEILKAVIYPSSLASDLRFPPSS